MNENDLRDCFAMFAMMNKAFKMGEEKWDAERCYAAADAMIEARTKESEEPEVGIVAVKSRRRK